MARARSTWTPEQARAMAVKALAAKRLRAEARRAAAVGLPIIPTAPPWEHTLTARTRAQVAGLLDLLDRERLKGNPDGQRLNWLASALERLAELDRVLSGRPLPGSRRPAPEQRADPRGPVRPPVEPRAPALPTPADNGAEEEQPKPGLLSEPPDW